MAIDDRMTSQALIRAKQQAYNVCLTGHALTLISVTSDKDEMGTPKNESTIPLKAFPVRYNPYDREVTDKISWADNTDVLCYVPKLQLDNLSLTVPMLRKKYKSFRHYDKTYEIRYIEPYSAFAGDYLYVIFGGKS